MALTEASCIVGQKGNERAQIALSSLIHALYEYEMYALARLVTKEGKNPVMIIMAPIIETDIECLVDVQVRNSYSILILGSLCRGCETLYLCTSR
jgi:ATP-dependent DNA helicase 2 subunit 2